MRTLAMTLGLALACTAAIAQTKSTTTTTTPASTTHAKSTASTAPAATTMSAPVTATTHPAHNCMLADDKAWASLNLSADQLKKVKEIQAQCNKECGAMMKSDPKMADMMDKHEARVKAVLTPAQYDNWMKWCATQVKTTAPVTKPMEKK